MTHSTPTRSRGPRRAARHVLRRGACLSAAVTVLVVASADTALADTSAASATAVWVTAPSGSLVGSGSVSAGNTGDQGTVTAGSTPALSVLGSQSLVSAGVLVQQAVARADGTSAACAGLVGTGGSVSVRSDGSCTVSPGTGGVRLTLVGGLTPIAVVADALVSSCTADASGGVTGRAVLTNARVTTAGLTTVRLPADPAPNTGVTVAGLADIVSHGQSVPAGPGSLRVSALRVAVSSTVSVDVGVAVCGPNVRVLPTPALPADPGMLALAALAVAGWLVLARRWVRARWAGPVPA